SLLPAPALPAQPAPFRLQAPLGEPTAGSGTSAPGLTPLPLQLSLLGSVFPAFGGALGDDCAQRAEAAGNSVRGFARRYAAGLALAPSLTLHGFSSLGCTVDAGIGGGVSYAVPIRRGITLIPSAGIFGRPSLPTATQVKTDVRLDLLFERPSGRSFSV